MTDAILPHPFDDPASLREQNRRLSAAYLEIADILRAVYAYLPECPPHVAARLRQILAGLDLSCRECAARRVEERARERAAAAALEPLTAHWAKQLDAGFVQRMCDLFTKETEK